MKTAIVILNYNCADMTARLVRDIADWPVFDLVVVVDNQSPDGSYERLCALNSEKVHVLLSPRNGGYGYGNNIGIEHARDAIGADYVFISNPDVSFTEGCIHALLEEAERNPKLALLAPVMKTPLVEGAQPSGWRLPTLWSEILSSSILAYKLLKNTDLLHFYTQAYLHAHGPVCPADCVMGSFFLARASALAEAGLYDTEFFLYCEENVLGAKLKKLGYDSAILAEEAYQHFESVSISSVYPALASRKKMEFRSKLLYLRKYGGVGSVGLVTARLFFALWVLEARVFTRLYPIVRRKKLLAN